MELNGFFFFGLGIQSVAILGNLLSPNKDGKIIGICGEKRKNNCIKPSLFQNLWHTHLETSSIKTEILIQIQGNFWDGKSEVAISWMCYQVSSSNKSLPLHSLTHQPQLVCIPGYSIILDWPVAVVWQDDGAKGGKGIPSTFQTRIHRTLGHCYDLYDAALQWNPDCNWLFSIQNLALAAKFSQHCGSLGVQHCFGVGDLSTPFPGIHTQPTDQCHK